MSMFNRNSPQNNILPVTTLAVVGEAISIPAGAAGTIKEVQFKSSPILGSTGTRIGGKGDSSLTFVTGTCFTTEVSPGKADADLANGEYWIDYAAGLLHGKKATTGTSDTVSYSTLSVNIDWLTGQTTTASVYKHTGSAATSNIKATAGILIACALYNSGGTDLWVHFNDDANTVANADACTLPIPLPANTALLLESDFFKSRQHYFPTGIAIGISSVFATYTAHATPSDVKGCVLYV